MTARGGSVAARRPRLVIAGGLGAAGACQRRAGRTVGRGSPCHVRQMRLLPFARRIGLFGRRDIDGVMQPAMPGRRHAGGHGIAVVDHPASLEAERRVDLAPLCTEIAIALFVLANQFAEPPCPELGAESLAIPPREDFEKKLFHGVWPVRETRLVLMPSAGRICQFRSVTSPFGRGYEPPLTKAAESSQSVHPACSLRQTVSCLPHDRGLNSGTSGLSGN